LGDSDLLPARQRLVNAWAADHTTTLAGGQPVLVLDMYEHAYHMDFGAKADSYVDAYMNIIRWDNAASSTNATAARHDLRAAAHAPACLDGDKPVTPGRTT